MDEMSKYGSVLGLDTIRGLLRELGNPQDDLKFIHIAGTNGKGSVLAYTSMILSKAGYKTGRYVSPTVISYLEKIQIDGKCISESEFAEIMEEIKEAIDRLVCKGEPVPTVFEVETAMAFLYFKKQKCDLVVLETGLGGETDATNVIKNTVCAVFATISVDHLGVIGDTLEEIAQTKSGIIKPGCTVVSARQQENVRLILRKKAESLNCIYTEAEPEQMSIEKEDYKGIWGDKKITKIPFLRGVFNFIDSLVLGMSTLTWSAQFFEEDEPEKNIADQKKKAKKPEQKETVSDAVTENVDGKADATDTKEKKSGAAESIAVGGTVALSILMAVAIFIVLPYFLSMLFSHYVLNESLLAIVEGVLRIVIFVAYVAGISAMKDIRRVYMYHGAEHKCINCIERGRELTVKNVRKSSRLHKRCGTSFLLFVMLVSIVLFLFIRVQNPLLRLGLRILLIPVIAGISYELIRLAGRSDNFLVRIISAPGMWLQRLTTKEPDDSMIEVAIASVEAVFDWKAYLKETFGYDVEDWEKQDAAAKAQETEDAEAADGMEAGKAAAEESREQ